ncbi:Splicing factor 3B subunit 5 [Aphelenchoides besseyi]|nr:Splicing factor 3B subunit 5 [Aphelenchoides besseyi]KAI6217927.1 Splicing factor 3B subunit 5 [Aphelenchoides besseyi]
MSNEWNVNSTLPDEPNDYTSFNQKRRNPTRLQQYVQNTYDEMDKFADNRPHWNSTRSQGVLTEQDIDDCRIPADTNSLPCGHFKPAPSHIKLWLADGFREHCANCNQLTSGRNIIRSGDQLSGLAKHRLSKKFEECANLDETWKSRSNCEQPPASPTLTYSPRQPYFLDERNWSATKSRLLIMATSTAPSERFHVLAQLEHLQSKYTGTGHSDCTRWEWVTNQHRDTYASIIGHPDHLSSIAVIENLTRGRAKYELLKRMIQPCGPPTEKTPLDDI